MENILGQWDKSRLMREDEVGLDDLIILTINSREDQGSGSQPRF